MFNLNPLVETDCFGFKPGSEYCVMSHAVPLSTEAPLQNADLAIASLAPVFHLQRPPHWSPLLTAHVASSRVTSVPTQSTTLEIAVQQLDTVVHHNVTVITFKDAKRNSVSVTRHRFKLSL
ncbi:hypothetical protein BKA65DRAFT_477795 [Rhexocercosporidium sp. MPI-PUGE-AT-0058]|nr:hypothetical protein BKA65DRAFT_477795 [Rhexocercosporidium sp. MPI-PUGE-AT-0058]